MIFWLKWCEILIWEDRTRGKMFGGRTRKMIIVVYTAPQLNIIFTLCNYATRELFLRTVTSDVYFWLCEKMFLYKYTQTLMQIFTLPMHEVLGLFFYILLVPQINK